MIQLTEALYEVLTEQAKQLSLNEYQASALRTAQYPHKGVNMLYPACGLAGESGEYLDKIKKIWRNTESYNAAFLTEEKKNDLVKELGDVLWYIASSAWELGFTLEEVAKRNVDKLSDRNTRGVVKGEGDNR